MKRTDTLVAALLALTALGGTAGLAETSGIEDPMAEAKAFLASPTSLSQAIATAESAAGGKAISIEYQTGEKGAPALIMAHVVLADGSEKTVAINPADGKVMEVTLAANDRRDGEGDGGNEDGEDSEQGGENANN